MQCFVLWLMAARLSREDLLETWNAQIQLMVRLQSVASKFLACGNIGTTIAFSIEKSKMVLVFCLLAILLTISSRNKELPVELWKEKMCSRINFTLTPSKVGTNLFHLHKIKALSWKMNAITQPPKKLFKRYCNCQTQKLHTTKPQRKYISNLIVSFLLCSFH